ncbi:hypothetical protein BHE74_00052831 [Ensete ventricosum]|nr:hypothetical protein BHE74_00052831 [Ensete ventricosum]
MADQTICCALNNLELVGLSFSVFLVFLGVFLCVRYLLLRHLLPADPPHERPKAGLDPSAIAALPSFSYRRASTAEGRRCEHTCTSTVECAVCLSMVGEGETVRLLSACEHLFHAECIDVWLLSNSTCPVCRADARPEKMAEKANSEEKREATTLEVHGSAASSGKATAETSGAKEETLGSSSSLLLGVRSGRRPLLQGNGMPDLESNL